MKKPSTSVDRLLSILSFSDVHNGHHRLEAGMVCENLARMIFPLLPKTDILLLGGDFFDREILLGTWEANRVIAFIIELFSLCEEYQVTMRLLRGTWRHDNRQLQLFTTLHKSYGFTFDLRYFDEISVERIEKFDKTFLYIPDDLPYPSVDAVMKVIHEKLDAMGWDGVDYASVHGWFKHVLPEGVPHLHAIVFDVEDFRFVRDKIWVGHVHTGSIYDPGNGLPGVVYNGSTERDRHGEEEPKGCIFYTVYPDRKDIQFVENTNAIPFKTYDLSRFTEADQALTAFHDLLKEFEGATIAYVRIIHPDLEIRGLLQKTAHSGYKHIKFTGKGTEKEGQSDTQIVEKRPVRTLTAPTPDTLHVAVDQFLLSKKLSKASLDTGRIKEILNSL